MKKRAVIFACLVFFLVPSFARADPPPSLAEYRRAIADAILLVERASARPSGADRQLLLDQAAELLGSVKQVQVGEGLSAPVTNAELIQELERQPTDLQPVHARLVALRDSLADPPASPSQSDRARLKDMLSRPPFTTSDNSDLVERIRQAILDFLARLSEAPLRGALEVRDWITLLGLGLVAALFVVLIRQLRRNVVAEETINFPEAASGQLTSREAVKRAHASVTAGDYREAVRQLYLAVLLLLDERGRLSFDSSRTNHEFLQSAARDRALYTALQPIVETFERTWYGMEPVTPQEFEAYRQLVDAAGHI